MKVQKLTNEQIKEFTKRNYNKATIVDYQGRYYLQSYDTIVAFITKSTGNFFRCFDDYSNTTGNHVASFKELVFNGNVRKYNHSYNKKAWFETKYKDVYYPERRYLYRKLNYKQPSLYYAWY